MGYLLKIRLPADRTKLGQLKILNTLTGMAIFGPIQCYGKADQQAASGNGNPMRDSRMQYGDTPLGGYDVTGTLGPDLANYGQFARLVLVGRTGDAMIRQAVTQDIRIHGGPVGLGPALLRPTNGCVRVLDSDMQSLLKSVNDNGIAFPFQLEIEEGNDFPIVDGGPDEGYEDPAGG